MSNEDKGYCATCVHCDGVDDEKDVCICKRNIPWADWRNGKEGPCPFWSDHIQTDDEKLIDRIFEIVTNEEMCAEAQLAEIGELVGNYKGKEA